MNMFLNIYAFVPNTIIIVCKKCLTISIRLMSCNSNKHSSILDFRIIFEHL